jgi:hypothetical protein
MLTQMVPLVAAGGGPNAARYVKAIIEQIDVGGLKFEKPEQVDLDRQDTELQQMSAGRWVMPEIYDDHIIHSDRCELWLKKHPNASPVAKKMVEMHAQMHRGLLARMVMPPMGPMTGVPEGAPTGPRLQGAVAADQQTALAQRQQAQREEVAKRQETNQPKGD